MVFQGEDVSLTEDVLKKIINFVNTRSEWSVENRRQVHFGGTATGTIITVNKDEVLYLTAAWLQIPNSSLNSIRTATMIWSGNNQHILSCKAATITEGTTATVTLSPAVPIKLEGNGTIIVTGINASHGIFGWIEPKKIG